MARRNFRLFRKLCGENTLKHIVIATTMWEDVEPVVGARRETELATKEQLFKPALDNGAKMVRHYNTQQSACEILEEITNFVPRPLSIQTEMVDQSKGIGATAVGLELKADLEAVIRKQHQELDDIKLELSRIRAARDEKRHAELEELNTSLLETRRHLAAAETDREKLRKEHKTQQREHEEQTKQLKATIEKREAQVREYQSRSFAASNLIPVTGGSGRGEDLGKGFVLVSLGVYLVWNAVKRSVLG